MTIQTILEIQGKARAAMIEFQKEIGEKLESTEEMRGVESVSHSPCAYAVSFSTIAENNFILDPAFYSKRRQVEAMSSVLLAPDLTAEQFLNRLDNMIQTKKAKEIRLNPKSIAVLANLKKEICT